MHGSHKSRGDSLGASRHFTIRQALKKGLLCVFDDDLAHLPAPHAASHGLLFSFLLLMSPIMLPGCDGALPCIFQPRLMFMHVLSGSSGPGRHSPSRILPSRSDGNCQAPLPLFPIWHQHAHFGLHLAAHTAQRRRSQPFHHATTRVDGMNRPMGASGTP